MSRWWRLDKIESGPNWNKDLISFTSLNLDITQICVKSGNDNNDNAAGSYFYTFLVNGWSPVNGGNCIQANGIGTTTASVSRNTSLDGNICGDISHASFLIGAAPTPTPEATSTPTPSVTPSVTPNVTPSVTPSVTLTPSPTPTNIPSPTDEPKPTDEPEDEKDDEDEDEDEDEEEKSEEVAVGGIVTPSGMILGAYANTGVTEDILMTLLGLSGSGMAAVGYMLHDKKKKK